MMKTLNVIKISTFLVLFVLGARDSVSQVAVTNVLKKAPSNYIDVQAEKIDYNRDTGWIEAKGNVVIRKGNQELRAIYIRVNEKTENAHAFGKVVLQRGEEVWEGERLDYNFGTKKGEGEGFTGMSDPYRILNAPKIEKNENNTYTLHKPILTTCTNDLHNCHFKIKARRVSMTPGDEMNLRGMSWWLGPIPIFYFPYWSKSLDPDHYWTFYPGYDSKMGPFLLTAYNYRISSALKGRTHLDYRGDRGFGIGQDVRWSHGAGGEGAIELYFADDQKPIDDDEDLETSNIDNARYRALIREQGNFTDRDYLLIQANYLSDTDILEDFFESEHRGSSQPENYVSYTHRGDSYAASILFQGRINDFYSNVNRIPEVSLDFLPQQLGSSAVYYEGFLEGVLFQRVYENNEKSQYQLESEQQNVATGAVVVVADPDDEEEQPEDISVFRIDTSHTVYRPFKLFGFLNLLPRVGYRGTYYSQTIQRDVTYETNTTVQAGSGSNAVVQSSSKTNEIVNDIELGADFRTSYEAGMEVSFKAFKTWGGELAPKRHIVEPYADYSYMPEPSLMSSNIYQMDGTDSLKEKHTVGIGLRNKIQVKKDDRPFDIIDADVSTEYDLEPDEDEDPLGDVSLDVEVTPSEMVKFDFDASYDVPLSTLDTFNARLTVIGSNTWSTILEYRFRSEQSSLLLADLTLYPSETWSFNVYGRYEAEESRLEEAGGFVQRALDCMVFRLGVSAMPGYIRSDGTEKDDEVRAITELWLTAFPGMSMRAGRHRR